MQPIPNTIFQTKKRILYTKRAGTLPINIIVTFNTTAQTHTDTHTHISTHTHGSFQQTNESRLCASSYNSMRLSAKYLFWHPRPGIQCGKINCGPFVWGLNLLARCVHVFHTYTLLIRQKWC